MELETVKHDIENWIVNFVEVPHPALGNFPPCPYARQARINNKIEIVHSTHDLLLITINKCLSLLDEKDVVVIWFDHEQIAPNLLSELIDDYNKNFLMPRNYVVLEDHPDSPEVLNGVTMNFGQCGLLLLSKLDVLNNASNQLRSKGYYDHWPEENLDYVVNWRFK